MFSISERHIDVEMLLANVKDDSAGATILFLGTVRNHNDDYAVSGIYYEAYIRMAEEVMAKIEEEDNKRQRRDMGTGRHNGRGLTNWGCSMLGISQKLSELQPGGQP